MLLGNAIAYVCNYNAVESQDANANDVHPEDNIINKACGSSTAGRDRFSSMLVAFLLLNSH